MVFRGGGIIKITDNDKFIDSIVREIPIVSTKTKVFGSEVFFENDDLEIFINSSDDETYNIDISGNDKNTILELLDLIGTICIDHQASGFITFHPVKNPMNEISIFER